MKTGVINPYKWPYQWVTGAIHLASGVLVISYNPILITVLGHHVTFNPTISSYHSSLSPSSSLALVVYPGTDHKWNYKAPKCVAQVPASMWFLNPQLVFFTNHQFQLYTKFLGDTNDVGRFVQKKKGNFRKLNP